MSDPATTQPTDRDDHGRAHFLGSAKVVTGLTLLSRVLGMVRDMAILALGATLQTSVFFAAFRIPNLFRRLFGEGALSAAFVPVFTEADHADPSRGRALFANVLGWLAAVLCGIWIAGSLACVGWIVWQREDASNVLLGQLILLVAPFMVTICLLALGSAALNCRKHFAYPAFAPVLLNIFLIAAAVLLYQFQLGDSWQGLFLLAMSVTVAGVVQLLGLLPVLRRYDLLVGPRLRPMLPELKRIAAMTLPMMVPLGALQFSAVFESMYALAMSGDGTHTIFGFELAKPLADGAVAWLYAANRLFQFPLGVLAISLATVVFPLLSRHAADNDLPGLRDTTNLALRLSLFMGIPAGVALMLLAEPAVTVIFQHGKFGITDTEHTVFVLKMYCLGLWAVFCNHILLRAFFAMKDTRDPLRIAAILVGLNMLIVVFIIFTPLREAGVGLASTTTAILNTVALGIVLRRRVGRLGMRRVFVSFLRTAGATVVMAGAIVLLGHIMHQAGLSERRHRLVMLVGGVPTGMAVFVLAAAAFRSRELGQLVGSLARRKRDGATEGM
jgi:putative peptidoglycan lipid II flippase